MNHRRYIALFVFLSAMILLITGCASQEVEVTRIVSETITEQVEVTRIVTEIIEIEGEEVEVTRIIETEVEVPVTVVPEPRGQLVVGQGIDPRSLNPLEDNVGPAENIYQHLFSTLVQRDLDLKLEPALATSWSNIDDFTWEFTLREGVTFHNGEEFTAEDVKFTFDWVTDPDQSDLAKYPFAAPVIAETEIINDHTVRFTTEEPEPLFVSTMTTLQILPKDTFEEMGAEQFSQSPVGTGPYKFVEWVKDDHITMEANLEYWDGTAAIETIIFRPIPDASTRVAGLHTGELDLISFLPPELVADVEANSDLRAKTASSIRIAFIGLNTHEPPLDNVLVRQALNYAVDKKGIIASVMGGSAIQRAGVTSPAINGYDPDLEPYPYDVNKAKELLAEAGYPNGFEFTLAGPRGRYLKDAEIVEAIGAQLAEVGVTANLWIQEWSVFWDRYLNPATLEDEGFGEGGWMAGFGNQDLDLASTSLFLHRCTARHGYYCSEEFDALLDESQSIIGDSDRRTAILQEMDRMLYDDAAWMFLFNFKDLYGANKQLVWEPSSDEMMRLWLATLR